MGGSLPRAAASAALPWATIFLPLRGAGRANRVGGRIDLPPPTPRSMRVRNKWFPVRLTAAGLPGHAAPGGAAWPSGTAGCQFEVQTSSWGISLFRARWTGIRRGNT